MLPSMLLQAGVLGSQPSVPVIALADDGPPCALRRRIANQEMVLAQESADMTKEQVSAPRPKSREADGPWPRPHGRGIGHPTGAGGDRDMSQEL